MSDRMVSFFMDIVRIDSESGDEEEVLRHLQTRFEKDLGADCKRDSYGNLIACVGAKASSEQRPILLSCHADTVKPGKAIKPVLVNGCIRSGGDTILGADDKAGIAEIYEAVISAERHPPLEIIITREEEIGLVGARNLDTSKLKSSMGFLLDSDKIDSIIVGGPTHFLIDAEFAGKAAHAGMEPEEGISAIQAACIAISKLPLGRLDDETTANVGVIQGGTIRNGVPDKCSVKAECRSLDDARCEQVGAHMCQILEQGAAAVGATVDIKKEVAYRACRLSEESDPVRIASAAIERAGLQPGTRLICGGTDASILNSKGIETAVIGIGARKEHTLEEEVKVEDMHKVVQILHGIFNQFP